jgi:large subunit ribosomal protein L5
MATFTPLQQRLKGPITEALKKELSVKNVHALPRITRVTVNVGLNQRKYNSKEIQQFIADSVATITGQRPSVRKARKSVANFGIRENMVVGMAVTLRGKHMYQFLDRLVGYALPRVRDFRGLATTMDGHGNYSIGVRDQSIFPELPAPEASKIFGMQVQISTTAKTDAEALALLKQVGFPFKRDRKVESKA